MAVFGTLPREGGNAHLACLHVELRHEFLHVLAEVLHALLCLYVGKFLLRTCHTHLALAASPVEDGQGEGDTCVLLGEGVRICLAHGVARLRETELQVYVGLEARIGLGV